jgi:bifunctional non-homologous end joining protein LigD
MADQLSLRLEADRLPDLPDLRPMLPRPLPAPFDSDAHLFEPWWGGERAMVAIGPADLAGSGDVVVRDAAGVDRSLVLPEMAGLAVRLAARSAVLDGELVVVDAVGRADAAELERRLAGEPGRPVAFLAFDLLHLDGRSMLSQPLDRRRDALRRVLRPGDEVVAVPAIATEGVALYEAVVAQGVAGILARHRSSPYLPGVRSRLWRFIASRPGEADEESGATESGESGDAAESSATEPDVTSSPGIGTGSGPVLALISRLPLPFDEV